MGGSRGESESCADRDGGSEGGGVRKPPRKSIFFRLHSKITEYVHRTPSPDPGKLFWICAWKPFHFVKKSHI